MPGYKHRYKSGGSNKRGNILPQARKGGQQSLLSKLTTRAPKKTTKGCGCGGQV